MIEFYKQPSEKYPFAIDFDDVLGIGETITKKTVNATIFADQATDVTTAIISTSTVDSRRVIIGVKGGSSGTIYKITTIIETSAANIYEEDVLMNVANDLPG